MAERKLRAVKVDEKPPAKRAPRHVTPTSVTAAVRSGSRRQMLVALRNRMSTAIDDPKTPAAPLAALIKQHSDIVAKIQEIDDAARQRRRRSTSSSGSAVADTPNETWDESAI